ncbi:VWA domain-containing protein [Psychroserpens luteus]|uniref:VWA domain-containing protein n=1 Tax=Psychroserpens luteus TaxID=1434066 RepID=UPI00188A9CBF|nr:VWA domain-containing protein [Psychroserpens luteus]
MSKRPLLIVILSLSFFITSAQTFCEDISGSDCDDCPAIPITINPDMLVNCEDEIDVILILDESNSINSQTLENQVRDGVLAFLEELECKPVNVAIIEFGSVANYVVPTYRSVATVLPDIQNYFDDNVGFNGNTYTPNNFSNDQLGGTNWQAALLRANALPTADLLLMFTDGKPTAYSPDANNPGSSYDFCNDGADTQEAEIYNAAIVANLIKTKNTHMFVLGVGNVDDTYIPSITGTNEYDPNLGDIIADSDYEIDPNFANLAACFRSIANNLCSIIVESEGSTICEGEVNGVIDITLTTLATGPFTVTISNGPTNVSPFSTSQTIFSISNLSAGTYKVEVESNDGCYEEGSVFVTIETSNPIAITNGPLEIDCINSTTTLDGTGSTTSGVTYLWSTNDGAVSGPVNQITATATAIGTYTLTVTDIESNCFATENVVVTSNANIPSVDAGSDAEIACGTSELTINGLGSSTNPDSDLSYAWSGPNGFDESTEDITVYEAGTYMLTVTDNDNGCSATDGLEVTLCVDPCTDPLGVDTDDDGINDICDLDDDNDGILDDDDCGINLIIPIGFDGQQERVTIYPEDDPRNHWFSDFNFLVIDDVDFTLGTPDYAADAIDSPWYAVPQGDSFAWLQAKNNIPGTNTFGNDGIFVTLTASELAAKGVAIGDILNVTVKYAPGFNYFAGRKSDHDTTLNIWYGNGVVTSSTIPSTPTETVLPGSWGSTNFREGNADDWKDFYASFVYNGGDIFYGVQATTGPDDSGDESLYIDFMRLTSTDCDDTDGDGLPNNIDTDSDNDGCPDALEAFQNLTAPNILTGGSNGGSSNNITQTDVNFLGVPNDANGGQSNTTATITPVNYLGDTLITGSTVVNQGDSFTITSNAVSMTTDIWSLSSPFAPNYLAPTATDVSNDLIYTWTFDDGGGPISIAPTESGPTGQTFDFGVITSANAGTYHVTITHPNNTCINEVRSIVLEVNEICTNPPTVNLSSETGSTCADTSITISGNTFGGGATAIESITVDGAGTLDVSSAATSPFNFTYTPAVGDEGNTVTITVITNNPDPQGDLCASATATYELTINALPIVAFTALADLCLDAGTQLGLGGGSPQGGIYSGAGVTDDGNGMTYSFDSGLAGAGVHTIIYNYIDANGCSDSANDNVEVYNAIPDDTASGEVCEGNTYNYEGIEYAIGSHDIPRTDANGCSYKTVLTVSAYEVTPDETASGEVCEGNTYNYEGTAYEVGSYDIPRTDINGCSYKTVLTVSAFEVTPDDIASGEVCEGNTYNYEGIEYEAGSYDIPRTDVNGCSYKTVLIVSVFEVIPDDTASGEVCVGDKYTYEGLEYEVGIYDIPRTDSNGCPYKTVLTVSAFEVTPDDTASGEVCVGDKYTYEGLEYEVGSYDIPRTDINGCSYKTVLTVSAFEVTPDDTASGEVCVGNTFNYEGTAYEVGSYDIPRTDINGCSYKTVLTISAFEVTPDDTASGEACVGDKYTYEGLEYEVGSYDIPRTDINGCSYKTVLTISAFEVTPDDTASGEACVGDKYTYEGLEYEVGSYDIPRTDINGCSYKTVLTVSAFEVTPDDTASGEVCEGNTYNYEGIEYEVGSYDIPRTDINGCSYKTVLTVSVFEVTPDDTASGEVCVGNTFNYEGIAYEVGSHDISKTDANGCPYTTVLTVTAFDVTPDVVNNVTICEGDSYLWSVDDMTYTAADSPVELNLLDDNGCPYTATLTITEDDVPDTGENGMLTVCEGVTPTNEELFDSLAGTPNEGGVWTGPDSGVYTYTFAASGSCPEVSATVTVDYYEVTPDDTASGEVCIGNTFNYEGTAYEVGSYDIPRTDINGCSYKTVLTVSAFEVTPDDTASGEVCEGNTYNYEGTAYEVGSYDIPRTDVNGCSYKTVLTVSAFEVTPDDTASGEVCVGNTFNYEGTEYEVGSHDISKTDANGCPYTTVLTVTAFDVTPDVVNDVTVCEGDSYLWSVDDMTYTAADSPVELNLLDDNGCPYTATLTITEDDAPDAGEDGTLTICADVVPTNEGLFDALDGTPNEGGVWTGPDSGVYTYTFAASGSCPEVSATVTVDYYEVTPDDTASGEVCEGNTYNYEGIAYEVGSYDIPRTDVNGCSYKTVLTVSAFEVTPDDTASGEVCVGNTYNYEGTAYEVGSHDISKTDANGCPYTTVLTVTAFDVTPDVVNDVTVCEGDSYLWSVDDMTYTAADSPVELNLLDDNGCPYTATLTITEDDAPDAGENGMLTVCEGVTPTNEGLFDALDGTPNEGGVWTGPDSGVYTYTFAASGSCPEVSATVTVDYYDVTPDNTASGEVCIGNTFNYEGIAYEVGSYDIPRTDINGCSYKTVLTVSAFEVTPDDTASGEVCEGNTYNYEGTEYEVGSYDIPRTDVNGCSYKTVLTVSAFEVTPDDTASGEVCVGNTFNYEGTAYEVGSYDIPRTDINGCLYTTVLTVTAYEVTEDVVEYATVCEGGSYSWSINDMTYTASDSPVVIELQDVNGCSYTATLNITETPGLNAGEDGVVTVCAGETPTFDELFASLGSSADEGGVWSQVSNGDYVYTFESTEDCSGSSAYVKVYYYEVTEDIVEDVTVCEGGSYSWLINDMAYTASDSPVVIELQDVNGCSYTATLNITETPGLNAGEDGIVTVCAGETPTFDELFASLGSSADEGGVWSQVSNGDYVYTFESTEDCSGSSAYVKVYYYEVTEDIVEDVTVCEGGSYSWLINDMTYTASDSPVVIELQDVNGCSYTATLNITETPGLNAGEDGVVTVCAGETPTFDELFASLGSSADEGGVWSQVSNGDYVYTFETTENCLGSSAYVKVYEYDVTPDIEEDVTIAIGASYTWSITNETYTAEDSPVVVELLDDNGCTYTAYLKITEDNSLSIEGLDINDTTLVKVFPVPHNQFINILYEFGFDTDVSIQVIDVRGVILKDINIDDYGRNSERRMQIDLSQISDQMLLVKITTKRGSIIKKIVPSNKR